jgi:hypothetical protein
MEALLSLYRPGDIAVVFDQGAAPDAPDDLRASELPAAWSEALTPVLAATGVPCFLACHRGAAASHLIIILSGDRAQPEAILLPGATLADAQRVAECAQRLVGCEGYITTEPLLLMNKFLDTSMRMGDAQCLEDSVRTLFYSTLEWIPCVFQAPAIPGLRRHCGRFQASPFRGGGGGATFVSHWSRFREWLELSFNGLAGGGGGVCNKCGGHCGGG